MEGKAFQKQESLCVPYFVALALLPNSYTCMLKVSFAEALASSYIDSALNDSYVAIMNSDMYQIAI